MKKRITAALVMNILIAGFTFGITLSYFLGNTGTLIRSGVESFMFFTTDSNVLSGIAALVMSWFEIQILRGKADSIPKAALVFKFVGTAAVTLTFMTVMLFLGPIYGHLLLLSDTSLYTHLGGPLLAFVSFVFLEVDERLSLKTALLGMLPSILYGIVYFIEVMIITAERGGWKDFYAFNANGLWYVSIVAMNTAAFLISLGIVALHNLSHKKMNK